MGERGKQNSEDESAPENPPRSTKNGSLVDQLPGSLTRRTFLDAASVLGGAAGLSALAGCTGQGGGTPASTPTPREETVVVEKTVKKTVTKTVPPETEQVEGSVLANISSIPIYLGISEGYFEERNIEVKLNKAISGSKTTPALATGQIDFAGGSMGASTINAIARGVGIKLVADRARLVPEIPNILQFQFAADVYSEGMDIGDLEGMVFGSNSTANISEYVIGRVLQAHGLTLDDVELKVLPFPQMVSAFGSGAIDAGVQVGALATKGRVEGVAKHAEYASETTPNAQVGSLIYGEPFINQRPDTAVKFLEAYILGLRRYYELGPYSDEVLSVFKEFTGSPEIVVNGSPPVWMHLNGAVNADSIARQQEFLRCTGDIESILDTSQVVDTDIRNQALDNVGRVDDPLFGPSDWEEMKAAAPIDLPAMGPSNAPDAGCGGTGIGG